MPSEGGKSNSNVVVGDGGGYCTFDGEPSESH